MAAPQLRSPSLLSSQSRLSCFTHHMGQDAQQLPINSLAWGFSAWLAQILLLITAQTQTLINHTDTHHDYIARAYCNKVIHAHTFLFLIKFISIIINIDTNLLTFSYSRCWVEEDDWAHILLSDTRRLFRAGTLII